MVEVGGAHAAKEESQYVKVVFFSKSRLTLQKWLILIYFWVREYPVTDATEEAEVHKGSAIDVYQWLREVCSTALMNTHTL